MWPGISDTPKFGPKFDPKFSTFGGLLCLVGAHTGPRSGGMKGTYLGFESIMVSILDHVFKYGILGLICRTPENREILPISPKNAKKVFFRQIST